MALSFNLNDLQTKINVLLYFICYGLTACLITYKQYLLLPFWTLRLPIKLLGKRKSKLKTRLSAVYLNFVQTFQYHKPKFVCITETWLEDNIAHNYNIIGFSQQ